MLNNFYSKLNETKIFRMNKEIHSECYPIHITKIVLSRINVLVFITEL